MTMNRFVHRPGQCTLFGTSSDNKPNVDTSEGFGFVELDTGAIYQCDGVTWINQTAAHYAMLDSDGRIDMDALPTELFQSLLDAQKQTNELLFLLLTQLANQGGSNGS